MYYSGFNKISEDSGLDYNVSLPTMTNGSVTCTKTTSGWNSECSEFFAAVDKKAKGRKPKTAIIIINEIGEVEDGTTLTYGKYKLKYNGEDVSCESSSNVPEANSFATDSWATIAANTSSDKYQLGDEKAIEMDVDGDGNNETYHLMIVNKSNHNLEASESARGFVLQFKELLNITNENDLKMNDESTTNGGWRDCNIRSYLNSTIYNKLPSDLKAVIINTNVISPHSKNDNLNFTTNDKLFLFSIKEVGFGTRNSDSARYYTAKLDYYLEEATEEAFNKRKKYKYGSNEASEWWLRSMNEDAGLLFHIVSVNGKYDDRGASNTSVGISPGLRIGINN